MKIDREELAEIISDGRFNGELEKLINRVNEFVDAEKIDRYINDKQLIEGSTYEYESALENLCDCIIDIVSGDEE